MWKHGCIGDVLAKIQNGINCKQDKSGVGNKITRIETIADAEINFEKTGFAQLTQVEMERAQLEENDILFSHINSPIHVGKTALYKGEEPLWHGVNLLRMKTIYEVDAGYFNYFLKLLFWSGYWKRTAKQSVNQASVNQNDIKSLPFSYPPLAEQQSIVAKLDAAFAEINEIEKNTETRLASAKAIFENSVKKYFLTENAHCEVKKLSEIANYFNGLTYSPKDVGETGTVVLRSSNIQNGRMDFSDIVRVNKTIKEKLFVQPTDILICSRNGSKALIGKSSLVGEQDEPMTFGTFMMIVRGEYNNYLQWFFKSKLFKEQIAQGENTAINQITRYMLDDVLLPVPDATTQVAISNNLEAIDTEVRRLQFIYQNKINELHALKSAILAQELQSEAA